MIDGYGLAVFVDESKGGAGDFVGGGGAPGFDQVFGEGSFAGAEVSRELDNGGFGDERGDSFRDLRGLLDLIAS